MKKNIKYIAKGFVLSLTLAFATSCVDLEPDPLSFYTPDNAFVDKAGYEAALVSCRKQMKLELFGDAFGNPTCGMPIVYEYAFSDISIMGSPETKEIHNLETQLTPTTQTSLHLRYWTLGWDGIKYANTIINRIPGATFLTEADKNRILAEAYFHRAYWYYLLVHQWGDLPLVMEEFKEAKLDFYTTSRSKILKQMISDMEFSVQNLPFEKVNAGYISRAAGEHLLTKLYLSVGEFQKAADAATRCINDNGRALMKNRFGVNASDTSLDVFNDLFKEENISDVANKEGIFIVQERYGLQGTTAGNGSNRLRNIVPYWSNGNDVKTPDGKKGTTYDAGPYDGYEQLAELGRGLAKIRPTNYSQYELWNNSGNDLRHNNNNWYDISNLVYNNPPTEKKNGSKEWFGKPVVRKYVTDTIRCYFSFPKVKVLIHKDDINKGKTPVGGFTDAYIFRLAETYLMRAEAYYWLNNIPKATEDVNAIRERAHATLLTSVTLDDILDERARELFLEEHRKTELTRIAYIKAELGQDGYSLSNFSEKNWYYDRVMKKNNFYKDQYFYSTNAYIMKPYHVLWPIPLTAITANTQGHINQNKGYTGSETNIPPIE